MNELIKIIDHKGKRVVDARELHKFLGSKRQFGNWINQRIEEYGFVDGQDYVSFNKIVKRETGASTRKEYALTTDTAKEVSMLENNEKGKIARRYFIEAEKQRNLMLKDPSSMNRIELFELAIIQEKKRIALEADNQLKDDQLKQAAPKIEYHDEVLNSNEAHNVTVFAKNFGMSAMALNKFLCDEKIQFKTNHKKHFNKKTGKETKSFTWVPGWKYQYQGYCTIRTISIPQKDGTTKSTKSLVWFEKGQKFIYELLKKRGVLKVEQQKLNFK